MRQIERIETHLDLLASQIRRRFEETMAQQERGIAAHQAVDAMEEQAAHVGGRAATAAPARCPVASEQRGGLKRAVLAAVIKRYRASARVVRSTDRARAKPWGRGGEKLLAHGTEEAFDLAAAFGLIGGV